MIDLVAPNQLPKLPTPTVSDQYTGNLASTQQKPGSMHSVTLAQVFHKPDLFPTPVATDWKNGRPGDGYGPNLPQATAALMPTPKALDGVKGNLKTSHERLDSGHQVDLPNVAIDLLGTPRANAANSSSKQVALGAPKSRIEDQVKLFPTLRASDSYERRNQKTMDRIARDGGDMTMTTLARTTTDWGKFEPAIRRWEAILGRPAPEPTKPDGKDNNHRLSSKFTEWMMGLPDGWITGHDLKRNDELKLAGNGVVPQQAELALRLLLELPEIREN
jgi:DNA (cytosine-5)-methyltransferase 1